MYADKGMIAEPLLFGRMAVAADPLRARLLLVLDRHELTVSELCAVFQLPQSTTSRHLKALSDGGWLAVYAEGTSRRYRLAAEQLDEVSQRLWKLVREQMAGAPAAGEDARRLRGVLADRQSKSRAFFSTAAGEWDRLRGELFGARADLLALLALLPEEWAVGDLGCGTGQVSESLAPFVRQVVAVDDSPEMLAAARQRLAGIGSVDLREGQLEALPLGDGVLDAAVLLLVLPYLAEPGAALAEAARVVRPGGRVLVVDMMPHQREEYRQRLGHQWLGFSAEQMRGWMDAAGLERFRFVPLPADPEAKGPALFAATGRRLKR